MFEGTFTALVTPFKPGEQEMDFDALDSLVEWQLESGINGFVVGGTTGESATLSTEEKLAQLKRVVEVVSGRVPIIAGTGSNNTAQTIEYTKLAKDCGVDAALVVNPYYNKPSQEGLFQHCSQTAAQGGLPVVLYNIPGRTAVEILPETFSRLAKVDGIVAVKQAVDSVSKLLEIVEAVDGGMDILAGDDTLTFTAMTVGGKGVISASANAMPREMLAITDAGLKGDFESSCKAQVAALPKMRALFSETNPTPVKEALKIMAKIPHAGVRLPLVPVEEGTTQILRELF